LERFTDSLRERGPDGAGYDYFLDGALGLGHRRLSILDLSEAGRQPMTSPDGRYTITYNGEVFNFGELARDLEMRGHVFRTRTDTEVVLAAFAEWGAGCLERFNGMWAFAIWDAQERQLFLARDRFGIKPLYYAHLSGKLFVFASETRAFRSLAGFARKIDLGLVQMELEGAFLEGHGYSIFQDIRQILPSHYVEVSKDRPLVQRRWWHIRDHLPASIPVTLEEQAEAFHALLQDACSLRLVSDVPVATALSGGLDSSSVYSMVHSVLRNGRSFRIPADCQRAVVATFPGLPNDERSYAEEILSWTGGTALFVEQDMRDLTQRVVSDTQYFDALDTAPISSAAAIYASMRKAGITVSLDGHGVDEMLFGYRTMVERIFHHHVKTGRLDRAELMRDVLIPMYSKEARYRAELRIDGYLDNARRPISRLATLFSACVSAGGADSMADTLPALGETYRLEDWSPLERIAVRETFMETLPNLLRNFDRASMMHGVEVRMPFMDWRLVAFIFALPVDSRVGHGYTKLVLREAMKGRMAESIRTRTFKVGISSPIIHWFQGALREWSLDTLHDAQQRRALLIMSADDVQAFEQSVATGRLTADQAKVAWHELNIQIITS
jgi:asparagine synthase (glutamine-hydrolysing)